MQAVEKVEVTVVAAGVAGASAGDNVDGDGRMFDSFFIWACADDGLVFLYGSYGCGVEKP